MMSRTSACDVGMISLRDASGSSDATIPAALSKGRVSSRMRPFDKAMLSMAAYAGKILNFTANARRSEPRHEGRWHCEWHARTRSAHCACAALIDLPYAADARAQTRELFFDRLVP